VPDDILSPDEFLAQHKGGTIMSPDEFVASQGASQSKQGASQSKPKTTATSGISTGAQSALTAVREPRITSLKPNPYAPDLLGLAKQRARMQQPTVGAGPALPLTRDQSLIQSVIPGAGNQKPVADLFPPAKGIEKPSGKTLHPVDLQFTEAELAKGLSTPGGQVRTAKGPISALAALNLYRQAWDDPKKMPPGVDTRILDEPEYYRSIYGALPKADSQYRTDSGLIGHSEQQYTPEQFAQGSSSFVHAVKEVASMPKYQAYTTALGHVADVADFASYFIPVVGEAKFSLETANQLASGDGGALVNLVPIPILKAAEKYGWPVLRPLLKIASHGPGSAEAFPEKFKLAVNGLAIAPEDKAALSKMADGFKTPDGVPDAGAVPKTTEGPKSTATPKKPQGKATVTPRGATDTTGAGQTSPVEGETPQKGTQPQTKPISGKSPWRVDKDHPAIAPKGETGELAQKLTDDLATKDHTFTHSVESYQHGVTLGHESLIDRNYRNNPQWREHFEPMREHLRSKYGDTVTLYRAEDATPGVPGKPLSAYTLNKKVAGQFVYEGRSVVKREVPVDAIAMSVRTPNRPLEFLVENAKMEGSKVPEPSTAKTTVTVKNIPRAQDAMDAWENPHKGAVVETQNGNRWSFDGEKWERTHVEGEEVPKRETITPSEDKPVGKNAAGEPLYERADGSRYRMRNDSPNTKPNGYPDFGGDLAPVDEKAAVKEPWQMTYKEYEHDLVTDPRGERLDGARERNAPLEKEISRLEAQAKEDPKNPANAGMLSKAEELKDQVRANWKEAYTPFDPQKHSLDTYHKALVRDAIKEGKPVPPEVLKDYPDLAPRPTSKDSFAAAADSFAKFKETFKSGGPGALGNEAISHLVEAGTHLVEGGMRSVEEWTAKMLELAGEHAESVRPHLKEVWDHIQGERSASKEQSAETIHGNVREPAAKSEGQVPAEVRGKGVREDQGKGVAEQGQAKESGESQEKPPKTGLANQVQLDESGRGVIEEIEATKGKTAEAWQAEGQKIVEEGKHPDADYEDLAHRVAMGDAELTGQRVGILLEGKRRILKEIDGLKARLDKNPGDKALVEQLDGARTKLRDYLLNVQQGKGRWSDVGRALQGGVNIDLGNYEEVLAEVTRRHKTPDPVAVKKIKQLSEQIKDVTGKVAEKEAEIKRIIAENSVKEARKGPRTYTKADAQKEIQRILDEHKKAIRKTMGKTHSGTSALGSVAAAHLEAAVKVANVYLKLGASSLEDLVARTLEHFADVPEEDRPTRQGIIDAIAGQGEKRTISDAAKQRAELMRQIRAESTEAKTASAEKAKAVKEAKDARAKEQDLNRRATQAEKDAKAVEDSVTKARKKESAARLREAQKRAGAVAKEKERVAKQATAEAKRLKKSLADAQKRHDDLRQQIKEGRFRVESKAERQAHAELLDLQSRNRAMKTNIRIAMAHADQPRWKQIAGRIIQVPRSTAVLGHVVGMVTHAGRLMFTPSDWGKWGKGFVEQFRFAFSPKYHELKMQEMEASKFHGQAIRDGLEVSDEIHDDFSRYQQGLGRFFGGFGSRGMDALKTLRQRAYDEQMMRLTKKEAAEVGPEFANLINHATGYARNPFGKAAGAMFAPSLETARWWTIGDTVKGTKLTYKVMRGQASAAEMKLWKYQVGRAAQRVGMYMTALGANYGYNALSGEKDNVNFTDPRKSDWLRFKIGGKTLDPIGGVTGPLHFLAGIAWTLKNGSRDPRESKGEAVGQDILSYIRGKLNPTVGMGIDVATGTDFQGNALPTASESDTQKALSKGKEQLDWWGYLGMRAPIPIAGAMREFAEATKDHVPDPLMKALMVFPFEALGGKVGNSDTANYRYFELESKYQNSKAGGDPLSASEVKELADFTEQHETEKIAKQQKQFDELSKKDHRTPQEEARLTRLKELIEGVKKKRGEEDDFSKEMHSRGLNVSGAKSKTWRKTS